MSSTQFRSSLVVLAASLILVGIVRPAAAANAEDGGSGLMRVDYAWSMPFQGLLVSTHAGYFSSEGTPGSARFMTLTPSATKGLGGGFEAAAALPFEILTSGLDDSEFDRRFDVRQRSLLGKVRWSGPLSGPRLRFGVQGLVALPVFESSTRPGGDRTPKSAFDVGAMALLSANVGAFSFPVRIHANLGYWWSRDDGAVYLRQLPGALPLAGADIEHNNLVLGGLAVEAGLPRFVLFAEVTTEQLVGARAQVRGRENLWRLTPGLRTAVGQNISLTAGVSFDLSRDDSRTAFNPREAYPDVEFRVGLLLGSVLTRQRYESSRRRDQMAWDLQEREDRDLAASELEQQPIAPAPVAPAPVAPAAAAPIIAKPAPAAAAGPEPARSDEVRLLEERLTRLETQVRMAQIEARLRELERGGFVPPPAAVADTAGGVGPHAQHLMSMQEQIDRLARAVAAPRPASPPAAAAPAASTPTAPAAAPARQPAAAAAPTVARDHTSAVVVAPAQPAISSAPAAAPARDAEIELLWAEIDALVTELRSDEAAAAAPEAEAVPEARSPAPPVADVAPFPVAVGERVLLPEVDLLQEDPLVDPASREVLDRWVDLLAARPEAQVVLIVHVGGADREASLARSSELAARLRDYLALAGAANAAAIGMGASEPLVADDGPGAVEANTRLELERIR